MNERKDVLLIRADADAQIGSGHIMRCLALAEAWKADGGVATFVSHCQANTLARRLEDEGFGLISVETPHPSPRDWNTTESLLQSHSECWVVLDGYHFDAEYQRRIVDSGHRLLVIDDMAHLPRYQASLLLNQNLHAAKLDYSVEGDTRLLLGSRYVLMRSEFLDWRRWHRDIPPVARRILVTMGGGDVENRTADVVKALRRLNLDGMEVVVVAGDNNPNYAELTTLCDSLPTARLVRSAQSMPELMAWADLAVSGSGSTSWELAFMGLPAVLLVLAENQAAIAAELERQGTAISLGAVDSQSGHDAVFALKRLSLDHGLRQAMAKAGRRLIDGEGAARVVAAMKRGD